MKKSAITLLLLLFPVVYLSGQSAPMYSALSLTQPMNRDGSGTAWVPDSIEMEGYSVVTAAGAFYFHGAFSGGYNAQDVLVNGARSASQFIFPGWIMGMWYGALSDQDQLVARIMMSPDPLTMGGNGYPLLFQSGETYQGSHLVDRQHPHDLFDELSLIYSHTFDYQTSAFLYFGYPGEPALGPAAYMHRKSSGSLVTAPLGHHWQDSTHVTFGVLTAGLIMGGAKLDASVFTGREPDEDRIAFDLPRFDSYSIRLSANPIEDISVQVSYAFLKSPETLEPENDLWRLTASVMHHLSIATNTALNSALIWGANLHGGSHGARQSILFETAFVWEKFGLSGRFEGLQKSGDELGLHHLEESVFTIATATVGTSWAFLSAGGLDFALAFQLSLYGYDAGLSSYYGNFPVSAGAYLTVKPGPMK